MGRKYLISFDFRKCAGNIATASMSLQQNTKTKRATTQTTLFLI